MIEKIIIHKNTVLSKLEFIGGIEMNKFQSSLLNVILATSMIYIFYSMVSDEKSSKWFKWYNQMNSEEQKRYDPKIYVHRLKKVLLLIVMVGAIGFLLSFLVSSISIITFILILIILLFSIMYTGPKGCKVQK